jgi:hypothetical protein
MVKTSSQGHSVRETPPRQRMGGWGEVWGLRSGSKIEGGLHSFIGTLLLDLQGEGDNSSRKTPRLRSTQLYHVFL